MFSGGVVPPLPSHDNAPLYSTTATTSATGDSPNNDGRGVAADGEVCRLRERAGALRPEASTAEGALRDARCRRKDTRDGDVADWIIDSLLLLASLSGGDATAAVAVGPSSLLLSSPLLIPPLLSAQALADWMREGHAMSLESLANVAETLYERETNAAVGPRG